MRESYGEGLANHTDPESWDNGSNVMAEALTGARAGQVLRREIRVNSRVPTLWDGTEGAGRTRICPSSKKLLKKNLHKIVDSTVSIS